MGSIPQPPDSQPPLTVGTAGETFATAADHFRREGIRVLTARYLELSERAKRRIPTPIERKELDGCDLALNTLQAMGGADGTA